MQTDFALEKQKKEVDADAYLSYWNAPCRKNVCYSSGFIKIRTTATDMHDSPFSSAITPQVHN